MLSPIMPAPFQGTVKHCGMFSALGLGTGPSTGLCVQRTTQ